VNFHERLHGVLRNEGVWQYQLEPEFNGAFGGTNGGVLTALCLNAAHNLCPDRKPISIDARFIRSFRPGIATVVPELLSNGRKLTTASIDLFNSQEQLCVRATASFADMSTLADIDRHEAETAAAHEQNLPDEGKLWRAPAAQPIPLITPFQPRYMGKSTLGTSTSVEIIWSESACLPEAACIAADISVGPPVAAITRGEQIAIPNPDLSLRFTGVQANPKRLVATCRLDSLNAGIATTSLRVLAGDCIIATGVSMTTCLAV